MVEGAGDVLVRPSPRPVASLRLALASAAVALPRRAARRERRDHPLRLADRDRASPCLATAPCSIDTAVSIAEGLVAGDTVLLAPGTYHPTASVEVFPAITISGEPGEPAPLIEATGNFGLYLQARKLGARHPHRLAGRDHHRVRRGTSAAWSNGSSRPAKPTRPAPSATPPLRDSLCESVPTLGGGTGIFAFISAPVPLTQVTEPLQRHRDRRQRRDRRRGERRSDGRGQRHQHDRLRWGVSTSRRGRSRPRRRSKSPSRTPTSKKSNSKAAKRRSPRRPKTATRKRHRSSSTKRRGDYREAESSPTRLAGDLAVVLPAELDLAGTRARPTAPGRSGSTSAPTSTSARRRTAERRRAARRDRRHDRPRTSPTTRPPTAPSRAARPRPTAEPLEAGAEAGQVHRHRQGAEGHDDLLHPLGRRLGEARSARQEDGERQEEDGHPRHAPSSPGKAAPTASSSTAR